MELTWGKAPAVAILRTQQQLYSIAA